MKSSVVLLLLFLLAVTSGCRTASRSSGHSSDHPISGTNVAPAQPAPATNNNFGDGRWHTVKVTPRPKNISTWNKLNPVWWYGNLDDSEPPAWFKPGEERRTAKWRARNPFHNFTFYVIGIADKPHYRSGNYPRRTSNPNGGWNVAVARRKLVFLPFVSYTRKKFEFYFGWRTGGNFGVKVNYNATKPPRSGRNQTQSPSETSPSDKTAVPSGP